MIRYFIFLSFFLLVSCESNKKDTALVIPSEIREDNDKLNTFIVSDNALDIVVESPVLQDVFETTVVSTTYTAPENEWSPVSIPVLYYHSIAVVPGNNAVLHPDRFIEQIEYLVQEGYRSLTLSEFTLILEQKQQAPLKPVLLTFDDGYEDNYLSVMPILQKYGLKATLFVSTGLVGKKGYLTWEQIREMSRKGWDIQPHGVTHSRLAELTKEEHSLEIIESRKQIEKELGTSADFYCYPYGEYNNSLLNLLKDIGFRYAFTIEQGNADNKQDPLLLKRIFISGSDQLGQFIKKIGQ